MNRALAVAIVVFLAVSHAMGGDAEDQLVKARWKHRVFLVFSSDPASKECVSLEGQLHARHQQLQERDVIVLRVSLEGNPDLARRYDVSNRLFKLILIGKDGGEKFRQSAPDLQALFSLIDSMPMRLKEVQK